MNQIFKRTTTTTIQCLSSCNTHQSSNINISKTTLLFNKPTTFTSSTTRNISFLKFLNPFNYYNKDDNVNTSQKKRIQYELKEGISWDYKEILNNPNMKLFYGTPRAIPLVQSHDCPKFQAVDLYGKTVDYPEALPSDGKPMLMCVTLKPYFGQHFVDSWTEPWKNRYPHLPVHHVVLYYQNAYKFLGSFIKGSRRTKQQQSGVLEYWSHQPINFLKDVNNIHDTLTISNPLGAYTYLIVDGKIRWKASGKSTPEELDHLFKITQNLIDTKQKEKEKEKEK
ncbi:hypothetical protein DFA_10286 [Cavenderia fasciculata]|uniref:Uncharacterized protein n=1 Tax=Cavenderia fasciculata TaxID=261658 RepID=F4Q9T0_CACFS|nr:uncharacterized protein DFA_10286 [Cavenderia fasciculata]EGG15449.1 hypothetical protein DFA_10286 [Cavenderia fasciculata]|eukprot:XP_004354191.1 hypothetical protein DFA_10286 [Cavenderia fasciculata]